MQFTPNTSHYSSAIGAWLETNFTDQFTSISAFLKKLERKGGFKKGAAYLVAPVHAGPNPSVQGVSNFNSPMSIPADQGMSAVYTWSWYQGLTTINAQEAAAVRTEHEVIDLLEERLKSTVASFGDRIMTDLFSTSDATLGKVAGVPYAVDAPSTSANSFGGIQRSNSQNPWWRAVVINAGNQPLTLERLARAYNQAQANGGVGPTLIVMPTDLFGAFEALLLANTQYATDQELLQSGHQGYLYKGATVVFDPRCPAGTVFLLNTNDIYFVKQTDTPTSEPVKFPDRLVSGYTHGWACALVAKRLNSSARINQLSV